ncbi:MAG: DNA-processing protein DprA [Bacteroidia bacterium]
MDESLWYKIALSLVPYIGDIRAKLLVSHCGSAEAVFKEKRSNLSKIPGIGMHAKEIFDAAILNRAEKELRFVQKHSVNVLFYTDKNYPKRLLHCEDGPVLLYFKGNADLNKTKVISVVGTRTATDYGKQLCRQLIADLAIYDPLIVSGLAYGIDTCAHRSAIDNRLATVCGLAHGLDKIYPALNRDLAVEMLENGGWLTDFTTGTRPDRENFPRRNRIVAGMSDATIVIESKLGGGSLITADIANSYNRDVFAFPGRVGDECSAGCNAFIKQNRAALIQSALDVVYVMGWEQKGKKAVQKQLFVELNSEEEKLVKILKEKESLAIDDLCLVSNLPMSKVSSLLLTLEFSGIVRSLPGKIYRLN